MLKDWFVLSLGILSVTPASAADYIVKFKDRMMLQSVRLGATLEGGTVSDVYSYGGLVKVAINRDIENILLRFLQRDDVEYVVQDFKLNMVATPNDPDFQKQWNLEKVRAAHAWDLAVGSRKTVAAVIDTGIDFRHPDIAENMWRNPNEIAGNGIDDDANGYVDDVLGWDFYENDAEPQDGVSDKNPGHGTHCAGIVGAVGNNGVGLSGVSPKVSLMALRFISPTGQGDLMGAIRAIDYAVMKKVDVISASWGAAVSATQAKPLIEAVGRADAAGVVFVAAAANDGKSNDVRSMYPANSDFPGVISVAASDPNDAKPTWSNYGKETVSLASPGLKILSTLPGSKYGELSGTSMATPLVAGLVALIRSYEQASGGNRLAHQEVKSLLQKSGAKVAIETACMCRIDAAAALDRLETNELTVSPAAETFAVNATGNMSAFGGQGPYSFTSANPAVLQMTYSGAWTAKGVGETTVTVTDGTGKTDTSLTLRVSNSSKEEAGECPLGDPTVCEALCGVMPELPWCN